MRCLLPSLFVLSALTALHSAARCQAPAQSAPQPTTQATPAQSGITIKTHARIVIEDVVVTDNKQRPVASTTEDLLANGNVAGPDAKLTPPPPPPTAQKSAPPTPPQ